MFWPSARERSSARSASSSPRRAFGWGTVGWTAAGLAVGALVYYLLDGVVARIGSAGRGQSGRASGSNAGTALALGAFLDGIPEQMVLGIGLAAGEGSVRSRA